MMPKPFIDLNNRSKKNTKTGGDILILPKEVPICSAGLEMKPNGRDNLQNCQKWRCAPVLKIPAPLLVLMPSTDVPTIPTRRTTYDCSLRRYMTRPNRSRFTNAAHPLSARTDVKRSTWKLYGIVLQKCGTSASTVLLQSIVF